MSDHVQAITEVTTDQAQLTTDPQKTIRMKTHKVLFLALIVSAAFALSAQADNGHRGSGGSARSNGSASAHYSSPAIHSSSGFRYGGGWAFAPSPRMSMRSCRFSQRHAFSGGHARIVHRH